jgi:hypothetical protein
MVLPVAYIDHSLMEAARGHSKHSKKYNTERAGIENKAW